MKAVVGVFLALVAVATACTQLRRLKVKTQWVEAYGSGLRREVLGGGAFYKFFQKYPETREGLFGRVNGLNQQSAEFRAHLVRVLGGLDMCISLLDDEPTLNAQLKHLNGQHKVREGVTAQHFTDFGSVLADVIAVKLGRHFDRDAFVDCYGVIVAGLTA